MYKRYMSQAASLTYQSNALNKCIVGDAHWHVSQDGFKTSSASAVQPAHAADNGCLQALVPL